MIPQRRKRQALGIRQPSHIRCEAHMRWVRRCWNCAIAGKADHVCEGKMNAHHAREGANGGMGLKPDDTTVVPLCATAHSEIHNKGWQSFERKYGVDLSKMAEELARLSPHKHRWSKT